MSHPVPQPSKAELEAVFGPLTDGEAADLAAQVESEGIDLAADREISALLQAALPREEVIAEAAPPLPAQVRDQWEATRAALQARQRRPAVALSLWDRLAERFRGLAESLHLPAPVLAAACAAVLVAAVVLLGDFGGQDDGPALASGGVFWLTPGPVTGFAEPVFTWEVKDPAPVDLELTRASDGAVIARFDRAFSPVPFSKIREASGAKAALNPGESYRVAARGKGGTVLAESRFAVSADAGSAPERAASLEGVIEQCKTLIAANRPADAWMLWAYLTQEEKADPRMQELKAAILGTIGQAA